MPDKEDYSEAVMYRMMVQDRVGCWAIISCVFLKDGDFQDQNSPQNVVMSRMEELMEDWRRLQKMMLFLFLRDFLQGWGSGPTPISSKSLCKSMTVLYVSQNVCVHALKGCRFYEDGEI